MMFWLANILFDKKSYFKIYKEYEAKANIYECEEVALDKN